MVQNRPIVYSLQQILSASDLGGWVDALTGDASALQAVLGSTQSFISNLLLSPTDPASLTLNVTNGFFGSLQQVDSSSYGSLPADTNVVLQLAANQQTNVVINNTLEAGQAQYVLIEAGYSQIDSDAQVLPYVNLSNPAVPFNGPSNSGIAQDTIRNEVCVLTVKYGTPATSGSEVPPVVDAGQVAVAYVDLEAGQTTITGGQILDPDAVVGGSPSAVLTGLLNSHHAGLVGQAPQIHLDNVGGLKEVQGLLRMANIFGSNTVGAVSAYRQGSGNPNNVLAGNSNENGAADTYYDYTNNVWYVCTTTGSSSTAVWTSTNLTASHSYNLKVFNTSGSYTPSVGTKTILVACTGAGGGGAGGGSGGVPGSGGGAGSTAFTLVPTTGLSFPATITIGTGGAGGSIDTPGSNGNNSQFSTTELSTNVTGYAGEGGLQVIGPNGTFPVGGRGGGQLTGVTMLGSVTISSVAYPILNIYGSPGNGTADGFGTGGTGGASVFGGGGLGSGTINSGGTLRNPASGGFGSGGGGGFDNGGAGVGANGSNGVCVVIEFVGN